MSYHVQLFHRNTKERADKETNLADFFDSESNLAPFTKMQIKALTTKLELVGFEKKKGKGSTLRFENQELGAEAMLTDCGLYLSASGEDAIFEISMFASEWAGKDLLKYDPQAGGWEA